MEAADVAENQAKHQYGFKSDNHKTAIKKLEKAIEKLKEAEDNALTASNAYYDAQQRTRAAEAEAAKSPAQRVWEERSWRQQMDAEGM